MKQTMNGIVVHIGSDLPFIQYINNMTAISG